MSRSEDRNSRAGRPQKLHPRSRSGLRQTARKGCRGLDFKEYQEELADEQLDGYAASVNENRYCISPLGMCMDYRLTASTRLIGVIMSSFSRGDGGWFTVNRKWLMEECRMSKPTVLDGIRSLQRFGYLEEGKEKLERFRFTSPVYVNLKKKGRKLDG